jgi:hypothetical protein
MNSTGAPCGRRAVEAKSEGERTEVGSILVVNSAQEAQTHLRVPVLLHTNPVHVADLQELGAVGLSLDERNREGGQSRAAARGRGRLGWTLIGG